MSPSTEAVSTALQFFKSPVPQAPSARMLTAMMQETQSDCPTKTLLRALKHNQVGVWWWPRSQIRAMPAMPSVTDTSCHRKRWQVLVWVVMSLLPLVAGDRSRFRAESEAAVGFAGMEELPLEAFPDAEEEFEEGSDSPWHGDELLFLFISIRSCLIRRAICARRGRPTTSEMGTFPPLAGHF
ncbi:hypothetical protein ROHU_021211 [Labeo rohita]|uniref:Uncharacterized protein n=1 Tax=Labeo rohita TaxID=84645 RepID=A0A498N2B7_LABRO|nr:hypothetical protein ROHU_021211 [Labeo rohita]